MKTPSPRSIRSLVIPEGRSRPIRDLKKRLVFEKIPDNACGVSGMTRRSPELQAPVNAKFQKAKELAVTFASGQSTIPFG